MEELEARITELEIRLALQDELLQSLNDTVAELRQTADLQQAQNKAVAGAVAAKRK